ncbi:hypothetical protein A8C56_08815 [Niabella ginsenosidivorans]|uniref:Uncharacterized protein n=1 Tax=Niabella ginsenosidivorans TaxID=1176587 RepID=A0A1A9I083_9BACT|nr:hypothetical protein [Niabella ginsenosidivorans]ANH81067.1 hypothetical protein A8C56_08815 [Niabella ginsenosidivorans]
MFDKLKKWLLPDDEEEQEEVRLTNQALVDQVLVSFKETVERESFNKRMMYDCSYLILMRPEDYKHAELRLAGITEGILDEFYDYINQRKTQYPRYEPIGNYWDFQYCPSERGVDNREIEPGTIQVISTPTSEKSWSELSSEHIKVSVSSKHSKYSKYDLNPTTFANIDILSKGHFRVKFNKEFLEGLATAQHLPSGAGSSTPVDKLATIQFVLNKQRYSFPMREKHLKITKAIDGMTSTATLLCINEPSGSLQKEHIMIRYDDAARAFYIALFADAFVNEQRLELSRVGENPVWHPLKSESSIVCGIFQLDFKALV